MLQGQERFALQLLNEYRVKRVDVIDKGIVIKLTLGKPEEGSQRKIYFNGIQSDPVLQCAST